VQALGIESEDDVRLLAGYFLKHRGMAGSRDSPSLASTASSVRATLHAVLVFI